MDQVDINNSALTWTVSQNRNVKKTNKKRRKKRRNVKTVDNYFQKVHEWRWLKNCFELFYYHFALLHVFLSDYFSYYYILYCSYISLVYMQYYTLVTNWNNQWPGNGQWPSGWGPLLHTKLNNCLLFTNTVQRNKSRIQINHVYGHTQRTRYYPHPPVNSGLTQWFLKGSLVCTIVTYWAPIDH